MIKNNLPYTNENGFVDEKLISNLNDTEKDKVLFWIFNHIVKADTPIPDDDFICPITSYGIKHWLEDDTKIYLTNNQFKHAMMICGHMPINENDLNWRYKIRFTGLSKKICPQIAFVDDEIIRDSKRYGSYFYGWVIGYPFYTGHEMSYLNVKECNDPILALCYDIQRDDDFPKGTNDFNTIFFYIYNKTNKLNCYRIFRVTYFAFLLDNMIREGENYDDTVEDLEKALKIVTELNKGCNGENIDDDPDIIGENFE